MRASTHAVSIVVAAGTVAFTPWAAPAVVAAAASVEKVQSDELLTETFESVWPLHPWVVTHPPGATDVDWGRSTYRASAGRFSIYCAGTGPAAPGDGGPAPADTASWAIVGPFDLSETAAGTMSFDLWLRTEAYRDVFMWLVSTDGRTFNGSARSTSTDGWRTITADLDNWGAAGSVIGEPEVWFAFVYQSDHSNLFEGAYLDEVRLVVDLGTPGDEGRTYTLDADFNEGVMVGLESSSDRLVFADGWDALPYIWVPNSVTGTVSKVDVETGDELGRYRTGPGPVAVPGAAAVDLDGACWIANRGVGTVVKVGLAEGGGCRDRNGNGSIDSSGDRDGNGDITGSELLAWGDDECVLVEVVLVEGREATHIPGEDHGDYEANDLQAIAVDAGGDVWAGVYNSKQVYHLDGATGDINGQIDLTDDDTSPTSAVVDRDGTLWLTSWPDRWVLGVDPATGQTRRIDLDHESRGIAVGGGDSLYVTGYESEFFTRLDTESGEVAWSLRAGWLANGVATTENGRVWVAAPGDGLVSSYGAQSTTGPWISIAGGPNGLAVDQDGKIWVAAVQNETIFRLNPNNAGSELAKTLVESGGHDATGDFTGIVPRNLTSRFGTWTVTYDGQAAATPWGRVSWQAQTPAGTSVRVRVRSSEDRKKWSVWEAAASGVELSATPPGRYLEIEAALQAFDVEELPKLNELTVTPLVVETPPDADFSWQPQLPTAGEPVSFQDTSTGEPTAWSWDFGDGGSSSQQNPSHTYTDEGSYQVSLTATNDAGSDSATATVVVVAATGCILSCSATVPQTAQLDQAVAFQADATGVGCTGEISYAWDFGDGLTSGERSPTHVYSNLGTLRWTLTASADGTSCSSAGDITVSGSAPESCDTTLWVPVVSRTDGANGSVWRSDLGLLGVDPAGADVELRLHRADSTASRVVTVVSGAMVNLVDVVDWIDPDSSGSGALEVCSDGDLVVDSRTYNVLPADHECAPNGTFGQHLAGQSTDTGLEGGASAWLGQLRESSEFRTNIGLVNTGEGPAVVGLSLFDATGAELTGFEVEVAAGQWHQENRPFWNRAGRDDLDAASAKVEVVSGGGVIAYASVVDNLTNDATTIPMTADSGRNNGAKFVLHRDPGPPVHDRHP